MKNIRDERITVYLIGFLFSVPLALTAYINSSFLAGYMSKYELGFVYAGSALISILLMLYLPNFLNWWGLRKTSLYASLVALCAFFLLALSLGKIVTIIAFVLSIFATNILIANLDIFVEDLSRLHAVGRFRGLYLSLTNIAWVLSQMISGSIINRSSFYGIYVLSALFMLLTAIMFSFFLHYFKDPKYTKTPIKKTIYHFIKNRNISKIYWINFILKFFFAWMVIYTPIYLNKIIGLAWNDIGIIFTIMLLPFVFLSFPLGNASDRQGEKKFLIIGFIICTLSVLVIPFVKTAFFIFWASVLFLSRVGAATIEVMSESYFFKVENEENADAIAFFRNTQSLSYLIAPLCASLVLYLTPSFEYIFFVLAMVLLWGLFITLRLKDVK